MLQEVSLTADGYAEFKRDSEELVKKYRLMSNYNQKIMDREKRFQLSYIVMADKWSEDLSNFVGN